MVMFKILDSKNLSFKPNLLKRLYLLYQGGYEIKNNAHLFLTQLASETEASFEDRKKCCSYMPFMSDIIDYYTSMLFATEVSVTEASDADDPSTLGGAMDDESVYRLFLTCADLKGSSMEEVMRHAISDALIWSHAYVGIDFPKSDEIPINQLEEEVMQTARPYLFDIDPECVVDWSCNDANKFNWVKLKSDNIVQLDPLQPPMHQIEFKIWTMQNGVAKWQLFQTKLLKLDKVPAPNDDIQMVDEGLTSFREIPVLKLYIPDGLALGCKVGPICEDIFQRTSILVNGENKSLNAMRVVFMGEEGPKPGGPQPSMVQENPFRQMMVTSDWETKGFGVLGAGDRMEVIESEGHAFQIVAEQIDKLIEKLKEVVHQMANSASAHNKQLGRSASSKQEDRHSTEMLLTAYGNIVRDFIKQIMSCVSTARNESIVWTVTGLDSFAVIDRNQLVAEAQQFPTITQQSLSKSFTKLYTERFYLALLDGATHEDSLLIRQEIADAVDKLPDAVEKQQLEQQAAKAPVQQSAKTPTDSPDKPAVGPNGSLLAPEGTHLQTGQHVDSKVVFDQLTQDYKEKDIQWVLHIPWMGPIEVPLASIDFSNKDNWQATDDPEHVEMFADKIANEGFSKPIILVNSPSNNNKMIIVDGHHRALAYMENNQPALAYVGQVGTDKGPWDKLHDRQAGSKQISIGSNQMKPTSQQKTNKP